MMIDANVRQARSSSGQPVEISPGTLLLLPGCAESEGAVTGPTASTLIADC